MVFPDTDVAAVRCVVEAARPGTSGVAAVVSGVATEAAWRLTIDGAGEGVLSFRRGAETYRLALQTHIAPETIDLLGQELSTAADELTP